MTTRSVTKEECGVAPSTIETESQGNNEVIIKIKMLEEESGYVSKPRDFAWDSFCKEKKLLRGCLLADMTGLLGGRTSLLL